MDARSAGVIASGLLLACGMESTTSQLEDRVVAVLVDRYETTFRIEPQALVESMSDDTGRRDHRVLSAPFAVFYHALIALDEPATTRMLSQARSVVVGAKDFRAPERLGDVRAQLCHVILFQPGKAPTLNAILGEPSQKAGSGHSVWHWKAGPTKDPSGDYHFYLAASGDVVALCTDESELTELTRQLHSADDGPADASAIARLSSFRGAEVWGYRKYRHREQSSAGPSGLSAVTPSAEALALWLDRDRAYVRLFANDPSAAQSFNQMLDDQQIGFGRFEAMDGATWQLQLTLDGTEMSVERLLVFLAAFGFGIYV